VVVVAKLLAVRMMLEQSTPGNGAAVLVMVPNTAVVAICRFGLVNICPLLCPVVAFNLIAIPRLTRVKNIAVPVNQG
jgi:hypothetical protein